VYPAWDHGVMSRRSKIIRIGRYKKKGSSVVRGRKVSEWMCECLDHDRCEVNERKVSQHDCEIESEIEVVTMGIDRVLKDGFGVPKGSPIILDIDEDYFAVDSPFMSIMEAGIHKRDLAKAQKILKKVFCAKPPNTAKHEQAIDTFLRAVTKIAHDNQVEEDGIKKGVEDFIRQHQKLHATVLSSLCKPTQEGKGRKLVLNTAVKFALFLAKHASSEGIQKILEYGFCLDTEEFPRKRYDVWVCIGSSDWDDVSSNRIRLHHPKNSEVTSALTKLRSVVVGKIESPPVLITVCRSLRDGYVIRAHWGLIEGGVMEMSKALAIRHGQALNVTYDHDCYWGPGSFVSRTELALN